MTSRHLFPMVFLMTPALLAGALLAAPAPGSAAVTVFGSSAAEACYHAASRGGGRSDLSDCDRALREEALLPRDRAATLVNRGIIHNQLRRLDEALADFDTALEIAPDLGEAYHNRGNTHFFARRYPAALADYTRAIELETGELEAAYFNRGLVREVLKDAAGAEADFRAAVDIAPDFARALEKLREYEAERARAGGGDA